MTLVSIFVRKYQFDIFTFKSFN